MFAIVIKMPVTVFLLSGIFPLVPGAGIYYTAYYFIQGNNALALSILIRTAVENIRIAGRATQGVIVMRFKEEGDRVISMALTDREQDAEKEPSHE